MSEFQREIEKFSTYMENVPSDTLIGQYIKHINDLIGTKDEKFLKEYQPIIQEEKKRFTGKSPFLSVVIRTQGKRPEMLREALLSLGAQSDDDFEVLLIGHKLNGEQHALVKQILSDLPRKLQDKIRLIKLDHGNRATPLNIGFSCAHGEYISILDDDDLVFDNWVEEFHKASREKQGRILHAYTIAQDWQIVNTDCGLMGLRASSPLKDIFCKDFVMIKQLEMNVCPLGGLSFPAYAFQELGILFDETLDTTEDWDFLMRTSFVTGVKDIRVPTYFYRLWVNAENSSSVHNEDEWKENYNKIEEKFNSMPVILPAGEIKVHKIESTQIEKVVVNEQVPLRLAIKERIRKRIPKFIWIPAKKIYRFFGGKKWLG